MSDNRTDEGKPSPQPTAATVPAALPIQVEPATVPPLAIQPPQAAQPTATSPQATSLPEFDARLIHIIEKAGNPPEITAIQRPEIVQGQILEQKEK